MTLEFVERLAVRFLLQTKMSELFEDEFEKFFQDLMCARYPDFVNVRTAGVLGDMGSDGLSLYGRKLYACYGPRVFNASKVKDKFNGDLESAATKRSGQFETFVFVHNDLRGVHPIVSVAIAEAVKVHVLIGFEQFGFSRFRDECCRLDRVAVEDLLGMPLPVQSLVYSPTLDELVPLLDFLRERRQGYDSSAPITAPSSKKLDFNRFSSDEREELCREMAMGAEIDRYYNGRIDVTERDEAAVAFREEYLRIREQHSDPDLILHYLEQYILGNSAAQVSLRRGALAVIAYFFQTCDIFENPPSGWNGGGA